jgi:thiol:disulfide interchange protein DsbA
MKRRDFSLQLAAAGLAMASGAQAQAQGAPVEGQQYVRLSPPVPVSLAPGKTVEVVEFFWYECPHCFAFDPLLEAWLKRQPPDLEFQRVPVGFTARHQLTQKLYYALQEMGEGEKLHKKIFNAIHLQNVRLLTEAQMVAFVSANGVDGAKFSQAYRSFGVATACARAKQLTDAYKIDGVPALGVQGRYYTAASLAGSHERALQVTDYLVARVRKGG